MRLSLQVIYAICGVFDLAYNADGGPVRVRAIGDRQAIPARYLEQIFQRLRKAGLVRSKRGPGGGYTLARDPAEITLRDVVEAIEGPGITSCLEALDGPAPEGPRRRPDFLWPQLESQVNGLLESVSLEQLCRDASRAAVERAGAESYTYQI